MIAAVEDAVTAQDIADRLNCTRETVYRMARRKTDPIPHIRVGREYRFFWSAVRDHLAAKPTPWKQSARSLARRRAA